MASLGQQLLRRKPVAAMTEETGTDTGTGELSRSIGLVQLSAFGIGSTIGTGIFIVLTEAAPVAGPAVVLSFVFAGVVAGLTAICYAELASTVPVSGSSYSYAYAPWEREWRWWWPPACCSSTGWPPPRWPWAGPSTSTSCSTTSSAS